MKKTSSIVVQLFLVYALFQLTTIAMPLYAADTTEKPLIIKGLRIGMDAAEAKAALDRALSNGWSASAIDTRYRLLRDYKPGSGGDEMVFGSGLAIPDVGAKGILIKSGDEYYGGYISIDESDNKVTRITFGSRLTNDLFSAADITPDAFIHAFETYYNIPGFNWAFSGWQYVSPNNYVIHITTQKKVDIKKVMVAPTPSRPVINFN